MKITVEQFTAAMEAAVAERGADYVYPAPVEKGHPDDYHNAAGTCMYQTSDGAPACIIGVALSKIDPSLMPAYGDTFGASAVIHRLTDGNSYELPEAAGAAQDAQDQGKTWGEALEAYKKSLKEFAS